MLMLNKSEQLFSNRSKKLHKYINTLHQNIGQAYLVGIKLYIDHWHVLIHPIMVLQNPVDSFRNILKDEVKVHLILFGR